MEANQPEEELTKMSFVNLKTEVTLKEEDQVCRHYVVSILNQGSLMKWDSKGVSECEGYPKDPFTERTAENCPPCGYYLSAFLSTIMRRVKWKPELHVHYCTGCRAVRELPAKGSNKVGLAKCKHCRTLVIDSLSAVWTYLATSLATCITEGQTPVAGEWTIHSGSTRRATIMWLQGLAENLTSTWERNLLKNTSNLPNLTWSTAIKLVTLEQVVSMRPKPISWPLDLDEDKKEETLDDLLDEMETEDRDVVVEFEGEFEEVAVKVTSGDLLESELVTYGNNNVTSGNVAIGFEQNNNHYVQPFNISDTAKETPKMANNQSKLVTQQAQLAASLASQPVPQPGQAPVSTPSQGAINRRQADTATGSTSATPRR